MHSHRTAWLEKLPRSDERSPGGHFASSLSLKQTQGVAQGLTARALLKLLNLQPPCPSPPWTPGLGPQCPSQHLLTESYDHLHNITVPMGRMRVRWERVSTRRWKASVWQSSLQASTVDRELQN